MTPEERAALMAGARAKLELGEAQEREHFARDYARTYRVRKQLRAEYEAEIKAIAEQHEREREVPEQCDECEGTGRNCLAHGGMDLIARPMKS